MMSAETIHYLITGGFASMIVAMLTLRSQVRKVRAESRNFELDNSEKATEILLENIVEPLKKELHETRRELALLRSALHEANSCDYSTDCPVLRELRHERANCTLRASGTAP